MFHYPAQDLEISKELGDVSGQAVTQRNLANTYDMMGDYTKALKWHTDVGSILMTTSL